MTTTRPRSHRRALPAVPAVLRLNTPWWGWAGAATITGLALVDPRAAAGIESLALVLATTAAVTGLRRLNPHGADPASQTNTDQTTRTTAADASPATGGHR